MSKDTYHHTWWPEPDAQILQNGIIEPTGRYQLAKLGPLAHTLHLLPTELHTQTERQTD